MALGETASPGHMPRARRPRWAWGRSERNPLGNRTRVRETTLRSFPTRLSEQVASDLAALAKSCPGPRTGGWGPRRRPHRGSRCSRPPGWRLYDGFTHDWSAEEFLGGCSVTARGFEPAIAGADVCRQVRVSGEAPDVRDLRGPLGPGEAPRPPESAHKPRALHGRGERRAGTPC